jgi:RNA 2',3'-cyclic 3'-phosphodiesterase
MPCQNIACFAYIIIGWNLFMRVFVAINVPKEAHAAIGKAAEPLNDALGVKMLPPGNWHFTLRFIGEIDGKKVPEIEKALSNVKFTHFSVKLSGAGAYPSAKYPRAIWIGGDAPGAVGLAAKVEEALKPFNFQPEKFSVHLTVARSKSAGDIHDFLEKTNDVCGFEVRSFALMKSTLMAQGAKYEVLREFGANE